MAATLEWKEPMAVCQWRWRTQSAPELRLFFRLFVKWIVILSVPTLGFVYWYAPTELPHVVVCFLALLIASMGRLAATGWLTRKERIRYSVEAKGLRRRTGSGGMLYRWREIEGYHLGTHPSVKDAGVLKLKLRGFRRVREWSFSTAQLSEAEVERAIQRHLTRRNTRCF